MNGSPKVEKRYFLQPGKFFSDFSKDYAVIIAIVALGLLFTVSSKYFFTGENLKNILLQASTIAVVAVGQAMVILTGEFDLSIGQNACITSCIAAYMMKFMNIPPFVAITTALLLGALIGLCNGVMVAYIRIPAFIATLGVQNVAKGLAKVITNAAPIAKLPKSIHFIGRGSLGFIPYSVIIMIFVYIIFTFISTKTKFGRYVYSIGGNKEAAYFAGIDVKFYKTITFIIAGFMASVGGIILMSRLDSAFITNGNLYEFDAIIASVIGGLSLAGGKGKVIGALFGSIFLIMFFNGMTMLNVDPFYQDVLKGIVLIVAIAIDVLRNRKSYGI
ncbi:MAG TPA: ABC transporter permease [Clostridiaceae bacterium]|nr:ABC transporter permease [Clostridiaceae bacterium]